VSDRVHISCASIGLEMDVLLGVDPPETSEGTGGWSVVDRPKNKAMTRWEGVTPFKLALPLMVDGFVDDQPIGGLVNGLLSLGRSNDPRVEPPKLSVSGPIPVLDVVSVWVAESVVLGAAIYNDQGELVRQPVTLNLLEFVPIDTLQITPGAPGGGGGGKKKGKKIYKVKKGDTLKKIAAKTDVKVATLRERNEIRDPNKLLKPGRKVVIP